MHGNNSCNVTIDEGFVNISLAERSSVFFMAFPARGFGVGISEECQNKIEEAISKSWVCARISIQMRNQTQNKTDIMAYCEMNIYCGAAKGKIEVNISSDETGGKTIVIDADNETFNVININNIRVKYDGEIIGMASNYSDVLNPDDDNGTAEYLIIIGSDGIQVLVSIPSFSDHVISITEIGSAVGTVQQTPGFTAMITLLAVVFLIFIGKIFRRRLRI